MKISKKIWTLTVSLILLSAPVTFANHEGRDSHHNDRNSDFDISGPGLDRNQFENLMSDLRQVGFDRKRIEVIHSYVQSFSRRDTLSAHQTGQVVSTFRLDDNRIEAVEILRDYIWARRSDLQEITRSCFTNRCRNGIERILF